MKKLIVFLSMVAVIGFAKNYNGDSLTNYEAYNDGTLMVKYFSHATGAVAYSNDTIFLVKIPENSRIVGGDIAVSAMGGAQIFDLGLVGADGSGYISDGTTTADNKALFLDDIACSNAVIDTFAKMSAGDANANYIGNTRDTYLAITTPDGVAWTTNETISGVVYYIAY